MGKEDARIVSLYRRHAAAWSAARAASFVERHWIERFSALVSPGESVLDIGCGPGEPISRFLTEAGHPVVGVDASPEMIDRFRANLPGGEAHVVDMRTLSLGRQFGGIVAWDSFFHLTPADQRAMFSVFGAHSQPGAPLLFTSGPDAGESMGDLEGEPLYHASLAPDEYRSLLRSHGFDVVDHVVADPTTGHRTIWLTRRTGGSAEQ